MWIDSHCHLQLGVAEGAVERARNANVDHVVCVGTDLHTSREAVEIAEKSGGYVTAVAGLHPHDAKNGIEPVAAFIDDYIAAGGKALVGVGECGLDYFYEHSPRNIQRDAFAYQIDLAKRHDLSLVIHTRDAWDETFEILRSVKPPPRTVLHCFTGGVDEARIALELGLYLSFSGVVTFKNSTKVQEAATFCPLESMLLETDSPFLAPVPLRGRQNEPTNIAVIGTFISELKKLKVEEFASSVSANTERLFNLHNL